MTHTEMSNGLELRWYPTVDATGRTYMESRWISVVDEVVHRADQAA